MFPVVRVNSRLALSLESLGTKRKFWFRNGERRVLFKAEERGTGEDWAEKIACELCTQIGLPHIHYELAVESDGEKPGVVCETCAPPPTALVLGNQLLLALDPEYPALDARKFKVRAHTVDAVAEALAHLKPPPPPWTTGMPEGIATALDVFTGYVMLDAWVANQDRHHENWGVLLIGDVLYLAPTFDHGAAMARNLKDEERHERLITKDMGRQVGPFVRRARSAFYADAAVTRPMTTVEAWRGFAAKAPAAATLWLARLASIDQSIIRRLLAEVPPNRMSKVCRDFTASLLVENQRRLLANEEE
ncbi:MAG TPA: phosphatidylinositol kinase [Phycisphaerae bacterium]|nr:phosphatidylinositol kinase [Phycisphaerae bacterium]